MSLLDRCARLGLVIESVEVTPLERRAVGGGVRRTALVQLRGQEQEGGGEDVTFQMDDLLMGAPGRDLFLSVRTMADLWAWLDEANLFEREPQYEAVRGYRRWAFEAAALDLALKQGRLSLGEALGREPRPVRFVVSPPGGLSRRFPGARLKIDAADLEPGLPVDVVDFKGVGDEALVERALAFYPDALLEDPPCVLDGAAVSWDAGIRSAADVGRLPLRPAAINVKPARLGSLRALLELYERCAADGIVLYGGGQHELGPGRRQIQLLAALFHPDAPNDVAPSTYNDAGASADLPPSPLSVPNRPGFG